MTSVIKFAPVIIAAALITNAAHAADGAIDFQGRLYEQTCTISVNGIVSPAPATIGLPTISASSLDAEGKVAGQTDFEIKLTNCSDLATNAKAFFESGADVDPISGQLINRGAATNVRLQLLGNYAGVGQPIRGGDSSQLTNTIWLPIINGSGEYPYAVRYFATGAVTPGSVLSTVTYSMHYQ